jgi:hypothetical protein
MPGFLGGSSGSSGTGGEITFPKEFIDPVTKLRVSQPENLIDTDFEYGLQPTKWETVELINNTPSFFSKSGDTTIPGIVAISTNNGTREITVVTATGHGLAVGIPINVTGTKSVTADGSYVINSIPNETTFTYLCKDEQVGNNSIEDLYTSIITGEFFQGSQIRIADSEGITTDGEAISTLTVKTESAHGFGLNTPFYFLNLNSTISQEFEASNTAAKSFDSSNSATAQTFDGSNTLSTFNIDWSNSATVGGTTSTISSVSTVNDTITVSHGAETFANQLLGTPLYYNLTVAASSGYFNTNPRGVVFLKTTTALNSPVGSSTFQVSAVPDGDVIDIVSSMSGTFQLANQARTFAGNNINLSTEQIITVLNDPAKEFDGANNKGTVGTQTVYSGSNVTVQSVGTVLDWYTGTMLLYSTTGSAATGLTNNTTYFVDTFFRQGTSDNYSFTLKPLPTSAVITSISGGTGVQTFTKIGISLDRDVFHIQNHGYVQSDMLRYEYPAGGKFAVADAGQNKEFYFVSTVYDAHNFQLNQTLGEVTPLTQSRTGTDVGQPITPTEVTAIGFTAPLTWTVTSGTLPSGLNLNASTGVVSGTPTEAIATNRTVIITVVDSQGSTAFQTHTYQFNQPPRVFVYNDGVFDGIRNYLSARLPSMQNSNFYSYSLDGGGNSISDGSGDMYDGGNFCQIRQNGNASGDINYNSGRSLFNNVKWAGLGYAHPIIVMAASPTDTGSFRMGFSKSGNLGADGGGSSTNYYAYNNATVNTFTNVYAWNRHVYNAGDPSIGDLYIAFAHPMFGSPSNVSSINVASDPGSTDNGFSQFEATGNNFMMFQILMSKPSGQFISSGETQAVVNQLLAHIKAHLNI